MNITIRKALAIAPLLLVSAILLAGLLGAFPFASDEGDNMLGALSVVQGGDIYKAYFSQHTPFAYYFTALFALMGVDSVIGFKLAFSGALLLFWLMLYWAYADGVNKNSLRFFVIAYPLVAPFCLAHLILAEVFTSHALVILAIEYLRYLETRTLPLGRMIVISLCVFVSVMSCFVSVYAVFMILLGFGLGELQGLSRAAFPSRWRRWLLFLLILAIPFGILLTWYGATGNLQNFYEQAYLFNRIVYSRYTGMATNAFLPFLSMPLALAFHGYNVMADSMSHGAVTLSLLLLGANLIFLVSLFRRQRLATLIMFLFLAATGFRGYGGTGYTGFHSMPYYIVSLLVFGMVLSWLDRPKLWAWVGSLCALMLFLGVTLPVYAAHATFSATRLRQRPLFSNAYIAAIQTYTRESDMIWLASVDAYVYIDNQRKPASRVCGFTPWVAEQYSGVIIEDLRRNRPKLVAFDPDYRVWGFRTGDYGSNLFSYIQAHYYPLDPSDSVKRTIYLLK